MKARRLNTVTGVIMLWIVRSRQRRELRQLADAPDEIFRDVGLARHAVRLEASKCFWQE